MRDKILKYLKTLALYMLQELVIYFTVILFVIIAFFIAVSVWALLTHIGLV